MINETILKDLEKANTTVSKLQKELRTERLNLINARVREQLGYDIEIKHEEGKIIFCLFIFFDRMRKIFRDEYCTIFGTGEKSVMYSIQIIKQIRKLR